MSTFKDYDMFDNFEKMIKHIYDYANLNNGTILKHDSPKYLIYGFTHIETDKRWGIRLNDFRRQLYYIENLRYLKSTSKLNFMNYYEMIYNPIFDIKQFIIKYCDNINFENILDDETIDNEIKDYCRMFI